MKQKLLSLLCLLIVHLIGGLMCYAQDDYIFRINDVISEMALKNDRFTTNLYTGSLSFKVPIYVYKDKDFELPISIDFASGGLRTHETVGYVGLGWNLNCGGYITRKINGMPDEEGLQNQMYVCPGLWSGYWTYHKSGITDSGEQLFEKGNPICRNRDEPFYMWVGLSDIGHSSETTFDMFSFNIGGLQGNFCLGPDTIYVFNTKQPHGEYKIEIEREGGHGGFPGLTFKILTGDGYKYTFKAYPYIQKLLGGARLQRAPIYVYSLKKVPVTYWPLVEIEAPNGRKVIFEYGECEDSANNRSFQTGEYEWGDSNSYIYLKDGFCYGYLSTIECAFPLKKIKIDEVSIDFNYEKRKNEIIYVAANNTILKSEYNEEIPTISLLKSISVKENSNSLPVKTCNLDYSYAVTGEPNKRNQYGYIGGRPIPFLKEVNISGKGIYRFDYYDEDKPFPLLGQGTDHWGYFNLMDAHYSLPWCSTNDVYEESHKTDADRYANFNGSIMGMLKTIVYPTGGFTKLYYEGHDYSSSVTKDLTSNNLPYIKSEDSNKDTGGVRIKRITDYSSNVDSTYREYIYCKHNGGDWLESSGILLHRPRYFREISNFTRNLIELMTYTYKNYSPYGNFLHTEDRSHIGYSEVMERFSDGSYCLYKFSDYKLLPDLKYNDNVKTILNIVSGSPPYIDNFYAKYDSRHTQRGKLIEKKSYDKNHTMLYSEEYKYNYEDPLAYQISAKLAVSYFYMSKTLIEDYHVKEIVKTTYPKRLNENKIIETTKFAYNKWGQVINTEIINSSGDIISNKNQFLYDLVSFSSNQDVYNKMCLKNIVKYPIKTQISASNAGIIAGKRFIFGEAENGLIRLVKTEATEISTPLSNQDFNFDNYLKTEETYIYDTMGNIIQKTDAGGQSAVYIWGGIYRLAEIKNTTLDSVKKIPGLGSIKDKILIKALSSEQIEALYKIVNSEVTVFEYKPLVGVSMVIDPHKKRTFYIYDANGQVIEVMDNNRDTREMYQYHYKNQ